MGLETERSLRKGSYVISDIHGIAWDRWFMPSRIHYPKRTFTLDELRRLNELVALKDPDLLLTLVDPVVLSLSREYEKVASPKQEGFAGKIKGLVKGVINRFSQVLHHAGEFWPYMPHKNAPRDYKNLERQNFRILFCSGIPSCCETRFVKTMTKWDFAEYNEGSPRLAFLTPTRLPEDIWPRGRISSAGTKLVVSDYIELTEGVRPPLIEDVIEYNEIYAFLRGGVSINPLPWEVANARRKFEFPKELEPYKVEGGRMHFGVNIEDIPKILKS